MAENLKPTELDILALEWESAKSNEEKAKEARLEAEAKIVKALGDSVKLEGSATNKTRFYKITTTGKLTYKLDRKAWDGVKDLFPSGLAPIKTSIEVDKNILKSIEKFSPKLYAEACKAIEIKPAKTAITIERIEV